MLLRRNRCLIYNATGRRGRRERSIDEEATERDESSGVDGFAASRYRSGSRVEKCRIVDEFVAVTGYHRNHAIRLLKLGRMARPAVAWAQPRRYGNAVAEALVVLWEASDRVCGKRLNALIPTLLSALERHGHLQLDRMSG